MKVWPTSNAMQACQMAQVMVAQQTDQSAEGDQTYCASTAVR